MLFGRRSTSDTNSRFVEADEELEILKEDQKTEEFESLSVSCAHGLGATVANNEGRKKKHLNPEY